MVTHPVCLLRISIFQNKKNKIALLAGWLIESINRLIDGINRLINGWVGPTQARRQEVVAPIKAIKRPANAWGGQLAAGRPQVDRPKRSSVPIKAIDRSLNA